MSGWPKAPDSRAFLFAYNWAFWSSNEGVGSNPTSDKTFFIYLAHFFIATSTPLPQTKKQDQEASNENFTKWVDIAMNDENEFTASEFSFIIEFLNWLSSNDF